MGASEVWRAVSLPRTIALIVEFVRCLSLATQQNIYAYYAPARLGWGRGFDTAEQAEQTEFSASNLMRVHLISVSLLSFDGNHFSVC